MTNVLTVYKPQELTANTLNDAQLNEALGFATKRDTLPRLKINKIPKDSKGKKLEQGVFYVDDNEEPVYSLDEKPVEFRILFRGYQYVNYDDKVKKTVDQSVINPSFFGSEFISTSGKLNCGRITKKQAEELGTNLSTEQQKLQKQVKLRQLIFGFIKYTGKTGGGVEKEVNKLVLWTPGNKSTFIIDDIIKAIVKEHRAMPKVPLQMTTRMEQTGDNIYYTPVIVLPNESVEFTEEEMKQAEKVFKYVKDVNSYVVSKYEKTLRPEGANVIDAEVVEVTTEGVDEEIPF